MSAVAGAIISALGSLATSAINNAWSNEINQDRQKLAVAQAELNYKRQLAAEQRQVERDSSYYKMQQLINAGVNPTLNDTLGMVGNNGVSTTPSYNPQIIQPSVPRIDASAVDSALDTGISLRELQNHNLLTEAKVALSNSQVFLNYLKGDLTGKQIEALAQQMDINLSNLQLQIQQNEREWRYLDLNSKSVEQQCLESASRIGLNEEQVKKIQSETKLNYGQLQRIMTLLPHEVMNVDADTALKYAQQSLYNQQESLMLAQTTYIFGQESREERLMPGRLAIQGEDLKRSKNLRWTRGVSTITGGFRDVCTGTASVINAIGNLKNVGIATSSAFPQSGKPSAYSGLENYGDGAGNYGLLY